MNGSATRRDEPLERGCRFVRDGPTLIVRSGAVAWFSNGLNRPSARKADNHNADYIGKPRRFIIE